MVQLTTIANDIIKYKNPNNFAIDPVLIASIISILIQIIRLLYDYNHPKMMLDDIKNPGIIRGLVLRWRIGLILFQNNSTFSTTDFINALRHSLKDATEDDVKSLIRSCM